MSLLHQVSAMSKNPLLKAFGQEGLTEVERKELQELNWAKFADSWRIYHICDGPLRKHLAHAHPGGLWILWSAS